MESIYGAAYCDGCDSIIPARLRVLQFERGRSDAEAGHSPSNLGGPYMDGYAGAATGPTRAWVSKMLTNRQHDTEVSALKKQVKELEAEIETLKGWPNGKCDLCGESKAIHDGSPAGRSYCDRTTE